MTNAIAPVLFTLFVWWFSTGLILFLDRLSRSTFRWSMTAATLIAAAGLVALAGSSGDDSVAGAYCAFASAIAVWAWHECSFLMGFLTGPVTDACPAGCKGWARFRRAVLSILYHELAIAATAVIVLLIVSGGPNKVGAYTFMALWLMRISTKLNLFLGVPNLGEEFLPHHLRYIASYFAKKPMNPFFPVSVALTVASFAFVLRESSAPGQSDFDTAALAFIGTLLGLGIIEHLFLVSPFPISALWSWSLRERARPVLASSELPQIMECPARVARIVKQPQSAGRSS